ncbi:MAG: VCBS repeat-containing protein [candidate division WOR-3 bacterium]
MRKLALLFLLPVTMAEAQIPLPSYPSWSSFDNDYSTGGVLVDVTGDGRIDLFVSNGNDMAMNRNAIYVSRGDSLEQIASWRSADAGYFGHCYAGDVDNDGDIDLAVAYLGPSGDLRVRVYANNGHGLDSTPIWKARDQHSSFDCCFGDVDLDGDLDLAISAGDAYSGQVDSARIYRNSNGIIDTLPFWTARDGTASDAVRFCDIDLDGDLELFVGHRRRLTMYQNNAGVLDPTPAWVVERNVGWVLRLAFGDYDGDTYPDLAVAYNDQLGDPNGICVFRNNRGTLDTVPAFTMWASSDYTSCVEWGDVDGDGDLDLAAGGWWQPVAVFHNDRGTLGTMPAWSWQDGQNLVCEAVIFGDVRNNHIISAAGVFDGDGRRGLFTLAHRPIQFLDSVVVDGNRMPFAGYCSDFAAGWLSFVQPPPAGVGNVIVYYRYSRYPDLAVTNWVRTAGSHLFFNSTPTGIRGGLQDDVCFSVTPNPFSTHVFFQRNQDVDDHHGLLGFDNALLRIYDGIGRLVFCAPLKEFPVVWDGLDLQGRSVLPGVYFVRLLKTSVKLVRSNH